MGRGLGKLQRLIIDALRSRSGGDPLKHYSLAFGWHDLHKVETEVANAYGVKTRGDGLYQDLGWDAAF